MKRAIVDAAGSEPFAISLTMSQSVTTPSIGPLDVLSDHERSNLVADHDLVRFDDCRLRKNRSHRCAMLLEALVAGLELDPNRLGLLHRGG